jgi:hypothetical protein
MPKMILSLHPGVLCAVIATMPIDITTMKTVQNVNQVFFIHQSDIIMLLQMISIYVKSFVCQEHNSTTDEECLKQSIDLSDK